MACRGGNHRDLRNLEDGGSNMMCLSCGDVVASPVASSYRKLPHLDSIRILRLKAGKYEAGLEGEFIVSRLRTRPEYEAISYTWADEEGDIDLSSQIRIISDITTDCAVHITKNCAAALRRFRRPHISRDVWIDSISINQQDSQERSLQVSMMAEIYSTATAVLVFLGEPSCVEDAFSTGRLFETMKRSCCKHSLMKCHGPGEAHRSKALLNSNEPEIKASCVTVETMLRSPNSEDSTRDQLKKLLQLRWFSRIWTLQEIVMAKKVRVYYGNHSIDWGYFPLKPIYLTTISSPTTSYSPDDIPPVLRLGKQLELKSTSLSDLIFATVPCGATDPRDKLFALRGLQRIRDKEEEIVPDYDQPVYHVYQQVSERIIRSTKSLSILALVNKPMSKLPSWAPNFQYPPILPTIAQFTLRYEEFLSKRKFRTVTKNTIVQPDPIIDFDFIQIENKICLKIKACLLGTVLQVKDYADDWINWHGELTPPNRTDQAGPGPRAWQLRKIFADWGASDITQNLELPSRFMHRNEVDHHRRSVQSQDLVLPPAPRRTTDAELSVLSTALGQEFRTTTPSGQFGSVSQWIDVHFPPSEQHSPCKPLLQKYFHFMDNLSRGRKLILTTDSAGVGPLAAQPGDQVFVFERTKAQYVLRAKGDHFQVIGEGFILQPLSGQSHSEECNFEYKPECSCAECKEHTRWKKAWSRMHFREIVLE